MTIEKQALAEKYAAELAQMARDLIAANRYFVLGTAHPDGHPAFRRCT
jgi:predicted pyridoxine 5'-phosphate oxidase superfamily flavin-nucleotide-binding protein